MEIQLVIDILHFFRSKFQKSTTPASDTSQATTTTQTASETTKTS